MMRYITIVLFLLISNISFGLAINVSGNVSDLSSSPIANHWIVITVSDSTTQFFSLDSVQTNTQGNYSYTISDPSITQAAYAIIMTKDCNNIPHILFAFVPGGVSLNFTICSSVPQTCHAQFTYYVDSINIYTYHFVNQSSNNSINTWNINGSMVSQQVDFSYTFPSTPSINSVCLTINGPMNCVDSTCTMLFVDTCLTSFTYIINGMSVDFMAYSSSTADFYIWDFDDGSTQTTYTNYVSHTYQSNGSYDVILKSYSIVGQDTCLASYMDTVVLGQASNIGNVIGYVFAGNQYLDEGDIYIYSKNPISGNLIFEDSTMIITDYSTSSKYFVFENIPYGNYYIKCIISDNSSEYGNYFNTWASHDPNNQHVSWEDAEVFLLNSEFEIANINLKEPDVVFSGGAGVISGEITNTMGINTSEQLLYLLNDTKNFVSAIYPSPTGSFRFDSLIMGTYYIRPELLNITSMDIEIQLNVDAPTVDDVQISIDSNHYFTSVNKINSNIFDFNVYPNPTDGFINLDIVTKNESKLIVNIYNMLGVSLYTNSLSIDEIQILKLDISEYKTGLYFISVSDGYNVSVKKILKN